ncbi:TPA: hypothetical protein TXL61_001935 [Streptococcus suis]|nr:hypothetical protein [Streptococcus suis]
MAKTYKRNSFGRMTWVWYERPWFWQIIALVVVVVGLAIRYVGLALSGLGLELSGVGLVWCVLIGVGLVVFVGVTLWRALELIKNLKSPRRISDYLTERRASKAVERGLLSAGLVRKTVSETMVQVPTCSIAVGDQSTVLTVEKLPSVADVVKVSEAVNSSLRRGKLADYAVTEPIETPDGLYYIFELHDVNRDLTFVPRDISELVPSDPYVFKLMEGVEWSYVSQSHAILSGLTGSHKTTTMFAILAQALGAGAEVYIIDFKHELTGFNKILGSDHVASDPSDILKMLETVVSKMKRRHERLAIEATKSGKIGVTGADYNARPVFIIAEELGALSEAYDSKERKILHGYLKQIAMLGRSCLYEIICLLQIATVESAPAGIKSNTNLKILLEKSTSEMVTQVFSGGYADQVTNNPGRFRGWFFLNGVTTQPTMFYVPDLHKHNLNSLQTFEELHAIGQRREYNETM